MVPLVIRYSWFPSVPKRTNFAKVEGKAFYIHETSKSVL